MIYFLFLVLAVFYNFLKFSQKREALLQSIISAKHTSHREMILEHHFYIFIFEAFLAIVVAHIISERAMSIGILGLGLIYLCLLFVGFYMYRFFVRFIEKHTQLDLYTSFKSHLIKEIRVNFSMIMLPILVYSLINWTFQDEVSPKTGSLWILNIVLNIVFVSVLTLVCSVIVMLRLIPNREIYEEEYLEIINRRFSQIGHPPMRLRWIETDIKNAFIVGLKILSFSNQTLFIGRYLKDSLSHEEFDAVITHELAHLANRHGQKRIIEFMKNLISIFLGVILILVLVLGISFALWGEEFYLHRTASTLWCIVLSLIWIFFNYALFFDSIRSHELEADGFAVIKMGASLNSLKSALEKMNNTVELPDYLKEIRGKQKRQNLLSKRFKDFFSTHPTIHQRIKILEHKLAHNLSYDFHLSPIARLKIIMSYIAHWRIILPMLGLTLILSMLGLHRFSSGQKIISLIQKSSPSKILKSNEVKMSINDRPLLLGKTLMYYIVFKKDKKLIKHFLDNGAEKGKTLIYLTQTKDFQLFEIFFNELKDELSHDEYFLVLRKAAEINFTQGYRLLVNSENFEELKPQYKKEVTNLLRMKKKQIKRRPASKQQRP